MDRKKINIFKNKLMKEKKDIIKILNQELSEEYGYIEIKDTELSVIDNHPGDIGTEVFMMEQNKGFENQFKNTLREIEESLIDIGTGKYGFCKSCGKRINEDRLNIIPYIKNCVECSKVEESSNLSKEYESINNKRTTIFNVSPRENIIYDGEDTYQDVAEFNIVPKDDSYSTGDNMGIMDEIDHGIIDNVEDISQEYYDETID